MPTVIFLLKFVIKPIMDLVISPRGRVTNGGRKKGGKKDQDYEECVGIRGVIIKL